MYKKHTPETFWGLSIPNAREVFASLARKHGRTVAHSAFAKFRSRRYHGSLAHSFNRMANYQAHEIRSFLNQWEDGARLFADFVRLENARRRNNGGPMARYYAKHRARRSKRDNGSRRKRVAA